MLGLIFQLWTAGSWRQELLWAYSSQWAPRKVLKLKHYIYKHCLRWHQVQKRTKWLLVCRFLDHLLSPHGCGRSVDSWSRQAKVNMHSVIVYAHEHIVDVSAMTLLLSGESSFEALETGPNVKWFAGLVTSASCTLPKLLLSSESLDKISYIVGLLATHAMCKRRQNCCDNMISSSTRSLYFVATSEYSRNWN